MFVRIKKMPMKILAQNKKKLSVSIKIIKDTFQGFIDDNVMRLSASLAYATLFSIIPLLSLLVTIGVLLNIDFTNQLYAQLEPIVGSKVIDALQAIMENAETTDSFSFATIISIGVTIFRCNDCFRRNTKFPKYHLGNKSRPQEELA